jgi:hypothetical protein
MREKIKGQVSELRGKYKDIKSKMTDFYQEKYLQELDKIKGDKPTSFIWSRLLCFHGHLTIPF